MAEPVISFITENDKEFKAALDKAAEKISDFRVPFGLIYRHWSRGNKKIFSLNSEGLYPVLGGFNPRAEVVYRGKKTTKQEAAEVSKSEAVGFIYPLLKRSGRLEKSLLSRNHPDAEFFIGRQSLVMGTNVPYAKFHQSDKPRSKLPQRKMIFIDGGPAEKAKDAVVSGRLEAWTKIIDEYVSQVLTGEV